MLISVLPINKYWTSIETTGLKKNVQIIILSALATNEFVFSSMAALNAISPVIDGIKLDHPFMYNGIMIKIIDVGSVYRIILSDENNDTSMMMSFPCVMQYSKFDMYMHPFSMN